MKQKDVAMIILVSFFSAIVSFFVSNALFASPKNRQEKVEVVQEITSEFPTPDKKYFNENSRNPTQVIQIGEAPNPNPFKDKPQQ